MTPSALMRHSFDEYRIPNCVEALDFSDYDQSGDSTETKIARLPESMQNRMLYLLLNGHKGEMFNGYWRTQSAVKTIAAEWDVDYRLIDAQVRVELSTKKHKSVHDLYLAEVEAGKADAVRPHPFSEKWVGSSEE